MSQEPNEFVKYAVKVFEAYRWKPARPETLSEPHLVVWGNMTPGGEGAYCVIDTKASLFKFQVNLSALDIRLFTKVTLRYHNDKEAIAKLDYYMHLMGKFIEESGSFVGAY